MVVYSYQGREGWLPRGTDSRQIEGAWTSRTLTPERWEGMRHAHYLHQARTHEVRMVHDRYTRRATEIMRKGGFQTVIASIHLTRPVVILDGQDQDEVRRAAEWLATGHRDAKVVYVRADSDGTTWAEVNLPG